MGMYRGVYGKPLKFDTTPHEIFVEMDELNHETKEWVEQCRWVKYEERREPGSERWGRPHVSSLDFHSLVNLRQNLDRGSACIILDFEGKDFTNVAFKIAQEFAKKLTCLMRTKLHCCGCCSTNTVSSRPALKLVPVHLEGHTISLPRPKKRLTPASKKTFTQKSFANLLSLDGSSGNKQKMGRVSTSIGFGKKEMEMMEEGANGAVGDGPDFQ